VLWDGSRLWALLEGHADDVSAQAASAGLSACDGPPPTLPTGSRQVVPPASIATLSGQFVAEVGVGVVHHAEPVPVSVPRESSVTILNRRVKAEFDPTGRLNPGVDAG
jgi:glycolate oxidase FAD binding subunit